MWLKHGLTGDKRGKQPLGSVGLEGFTYSVEKIDSIAATSNGLVEERILDLSIRCLGRAENLPF